jgi:hypothetical protein
MMPVMFNSISGSSWGCSILVPEGGTDALIAFIEVIGDVGVTEGFSCAGP